MCGGCADGLWQDRNSSNQTRRQRSDDVAQSETSNSTARQWPMISVPRTFVHAAWGNLGELLNMRPDDPEVVVTRKAWYYAEAILWVS